MDSQWQSHAKFTINSCMLTLRYNDLLEHGKGSIGSHDGTHVRAAIPASCEKVELAGV